MSVSLSVRGFAFRLAETIGCALNPAGRLASSTVHVAGLYFWMASTLSTSLKMFYFNELKLLKVVLQRTIYQLRMPLTGAQTRNTARPVGGPKYIASKEDV
jgi:hypothetical protein